MDILSEFAKDKDYVVGIVKNAGRDNEEVLITNFKELYKNLENYLEFIDMNTILIVGNSSTKIINDKMITPRGYLDKYKI